MKTTKFLALGLLFVLAVSALSPAVYACGGGKGHSESEEGKSVAPEE